MLHVDLATYGENLKRLRELKKLTQEAVAKAMGRARQGNLPTYEADRKFPTPDLVVRHAAALGCEPSELLVDVETLYDLIRKGQFDGVTGEDRFRAEVKRVKANRREPRRNAASRARRRIRA